MSAGSDASRRVLVLGLDSADIDLLERWCDQGELPHFRKLREEGLLCRLETTAHVMHVSAWPSFYTGALPGEHGMYHAYQFRAGEQNFHRTRPDEYALPPFWKFASDAGRRCIVLDAFMTYPLDDFCGVQILEYGTWTWFGVPEARPAQHFEELIARFGPYPAPEHTKVHGQPEPAGFRDRLIAGAEVKGRVIRWLLEQEDWNLLFATFGETHAAGHYLWHGHDSTYPTYPGPEAGLDAVLLDVYRAVDAAIGHVLEAVDSRTTVVVTSGDGMAANYAGVHLMPEYLHHLGLYQGTDVSARPTGPEGPAAPAPRSRPKWTSRLRGMVPLSMRRAVSRCLPHTLQHRLSMKWANSRIDWNRSQAFCLPNANEAYVRINRSGREPQGIVAGDARYRELIAQLSERCRALVNPTNQELAVEQVIDMDACFPGPQRPHLPDLVVTWRPEAKVLGQLHCPGTGEIQGATGYETAPYYTGNHRPAAFFLARGPGLPADRRIEQGHIIDLAPTILDWLGVQPPAHMKGTVRSSWTQPSPT